MSPEFAAMSHELAADSVYLRSGYLYPVFVKGKVDEESALALDWTGLNWVRRRSPACQMRPIWEEAEIADLGIPA